MAKYVKYFDVNLERNAIYKSKLILIICFNMRFLLKNDAYVSISCMKYILSFDKVLFCSKAHPISVYPVKTELLLEKKE